MYSSSSLIMCSSVRDWRRTSIACIFTNCPLPCESEVEVAVVGSGGGAVSEDSSRIPLLLSFERLKNRSPPMRALEPFAGWKARERSLEKPTDDDDSICASDTKGVEPTTRSTTYSPKLNGYKVLFGGMK